jgi:hypothetical protein
MQPVAIVAYCALAAEFLLRYKWDKPVPRSAPVPGAIPRGRTERRLRFMLLGMSVMTVFILIRYFFALTFLCFPRTLIMHLGQYIGWLNS